MAARIMFVFAHPDDETFGAGGTIARYAAQGAEVSLVTATDGEGGRPAGQGPGGLGEVRKKELLMAARVLGINRTRLLGYPDRGLGGLPEGQLKERLFLAMREEAPHVVVTFAPHGINGHPDHRAVSHAATGAFMEMAASKDEGEAVCEKLYYLAMPKGWLNGLAWFLNFRLRRKYTGTPEAQITAEIDVSAYSGVKRRAARCHASQFNNFERINRYVGERFFMKEHYVLAIPDRPGLRESDLLDGIPAHV